MQKNVEDKFSSIIKGDISYTSENLAVNLLLSRLIKRYQSDSSAQVMQACIAEVDDFSKKYASFMAQEFEAVLAL